MEKANAIIRKVGNEYCVFSHDGKNLGCSTSQEGAQKRLQQVEYFKHTKGSRMNYHQAFDSFTKALSTVDPKSLGKAPEANLDIKPQETVSEKLRIGSIANRNSARLLDSKDHFPVITETQAQSSIARVYQLTTTPDWYNGTLAQLRKEVYDGVAAMHPGMTLNVKVPVVALSDGQTPAETSQTSIKDPENDRKKDCVPQVKRPNLSSAQMVEVMKDETLRKTVGGRLMEILDGQIQQMQTAKQLAERLLANGLTADEYDRLSTYIQQDVLNELMFLGVQASASNTDDRRRQLLDKMGNSHGRKEEA